MLIKYCSLGFLGKVKCPTCIGWTSLVSGVEQDASNGAGTPESGRACCGMIDGSCAMLDVCWMKKSISDARMNQKGKMVVLPGLMKQLFWISWKEDAKSGMTIQMSNAWQEVISKQAKYLDYRRCLRGNFLDVFLVCIFGGYIMECRITWSARDAL